ncbi:cyclic di-GMP phosphodiesterase [Lachnospiraceae bacterium]|nr:response regulator [Lachnospiraceae bacterium]GFH92819.1 cyclic di-GMP phosphodiesterase [Lachnospiraceae bacterium]
MSNRLIWQERFNIGVSFIDEEHKKLFSILNKLFEYSKEDEKSQWACQEGIKYFKDHAMKHFSEEESYMASIHYIGYETHRRLHDNFRKKTIPALERELTRTFYSADAIDHFLGVCAGWLIGHTLTEDRAIVGSTVSKWGDLLPEEKQTSMGQAIIQILGDMFQLKSRIISECYGGERFGKGVYYRLVYSTKEGKRWEILLVFEQKLIVKTVGDIVDTQSDTVNVMLMNAARYMAQQFVGRIRNHFSPDDVFEIKEENLLTYEQFDSIFKEQNPQISLLFDTGAGYFAYCVIAPHMLKNTGKIAINADNAMAEIKNYLDKSETLVKKKILLVDDSEIALQAMKNLLEKDYTVALAKSGLAAIRCITLDRPDLILLDYEMPVVDGSQVLEMIRAEEDFADIPVIFLTGRVDKKSVQKVIPLKPLGFLLKTSGAEEIKKSVDNYLKTERQ